MTTRQHRDPLAAHGTGAPLNVILPNGERRRFVAGFRIGRDPDCDVRLDDRQVSRRHASVTFATGQWLIRDLQSSNGLFVDDRRVERAAVEGALTVRLGCDGPELQLALEGYDVEEPDTSSETVLLGSVASRYFGTADDEPVGEHTMMIRQAFQKFHKRQRRRYLVVVAVLAMAAVIASIYALHQHQQLVKMKSEARTRFYRFKRVDVQVTQVAQQSAQEPAAAAALVQERRRLQKEYEDYVSSLYPRGLDAKEKLILRVTRLFGECDVAAPPEYIREVGQYIQRWKSTGKFLAGVKRAQDLGYTQRIAEAFIERDLPPQFFYLALQESGFEPYVSGRWTRFGFAKGMWQFIPGTGRQYGLQIGPLEKSAAHDPADERQQWQKATVAAARYIKDLYAKKTQASGLLVMASYNWGEGRVIPLIDSLGPTPSERNFWQLVERYKTQVPPETYDYVFWIVSAAVIGEDPGLFGFPITNPLEPYVGR